MGREIRHVPPNWEHPKVDRPDIQLQRMVEVYQPMRDETAEAAWDKWLSGFIKWQGGELAERIEESPELGYSLDTPYRSYCNWAGEPPSPEYYRPNWAEGEATWIQVYETVSEGTPVSPPFETEDELIDYLVANGDFWDQSRRAEGASNMNCDPWSREQAETFVRGSGWAPSFVLDGKGLRSGVEAIEDLS